MLLLLNCFLNIILFEVSNAVFKNITESIFSQGNNGLLAAFSDFNSDKYIDLYTIQNNGKTLAIYLNDNKRSKFIVSESYIDISDTGQLINNVIPGDFDGDSYNDVLLVTSLNGSIGQPPFSLMIYWGNQSGFDTRTYIKDKINDSPLIIDFNGDMIPDFCIEDYKDNQRYYWLFNVNRSFEIVPVTTEELSPMKRPQSHSYVDLNNDLTPDILINSVSPKNVDQFERWINVNGKFSRRSVYGSGHVTEFPSSNMAGSGRSLPILWYGHSLFVDFDAGGTMKHLMLACLHFYKRSTTLCEDWAILLWVPEALDDDINGGATGKWIPVFRYSPSQWKTPLSKYMLDTKYNAGSPHTDDNHNINTGGSSSSFHGFQSIFTPRMSIGDFNFDGYPDVLLVLTTQISDGTDGESARFIRTPAILENVPCHTGQSWWTITAPPSFCGSGVDRKLRLLSPHDSPSLQNGADAGGGGGRHLIQNAVLATFFDLYNDGLLDVLVVVNQVSSSWNQSRGSDPSQLSFQVQAFQNELAVDASFVKILVLNGRCWSNCKRRSKPYGILPPGAVVKYKTTYSKDAPTTAISCQTMQTAHFALNLPYVIFGLGMRPNFIDNLEVGFAKPIGQKPRYHSWTAIIPNSQMIIIPYPNDDSTRWQHILLLTPSFFIIKIAATLVATCVFLGIIISFLHWKEKREDFMERFRNAHQFHFDAL